ncbi:MAG: enoyl-CoA hydratase [Solirubrobacterales bacterium]|jgi:acyl dehydratase|nr:enoyl-CoA hydratase [Solirubrobacterales bacterium]
MSGTRIFPLMLTDLAGLAAHAGETLGTTEWRTFTQEDVNAFADLTDDHNFIHVDPEAAARTPFGGTIAHGYFTLAMLAPISMELLQISDLGMGVNYGLDKVRFPAPVPVGAKFRGTAVLDAVDEVKGGQQAKVTITIEVEDSAKPAVVAECLFRYYA